MTPDVARALLDEARRNRLAFQRSMSRADPEAWRDLADLKRRELDAEQQLRRVLANGDRGHAA